MVPVEIYFDNQATFIPQVSFPVIINDKEKKIDNYFLLIYIMTLQETFFILCADK